MVGSFTEWLGQKEFLHTIQHILSHIFEVDDEDEACFVSAIFLLKELLIRNDSLIDVWDDIYRHCIHSKNYHLFASLAEVVKKCSLSSYKH